jgi:1-acyl-sn-glycerol-3-phosphate acyltransferase
MAWLYLLLRRIFILPFRSFFSIHTIGTKHIPSREGCIIAANHRSIIDPVAMAVLTPRVIHFMAKSELFANRPMVMFFTSMGSLPVRRGKGDQGAIHASTLLVRDGHILGIFPEGTTAHPGRYLRGRRGISRIALASGVPVVPVYIEGTDRALPRGSFFPRRTSLRMVVGPPLAPPCVDEDLQVYANRVMAAIRGLSVDTSGRRRRIPRRVRQTHRCGPS